MAAQKHHVARQHQVCCPCRRVMPPHRCRSFCTLLTAYELPGITGDDVLERSDVTSRRFDGAASLWQLLAISEDRLASPLRFVMCEACLRADCQACFLGACWSQTAVCVVRSVRVWARIQAEQEGRHVYGCPNDFVCRFVFSCRAVVSGHTIPRETRVACRVLVIGMR